MRALRCPPSSWPPQPNLASVLLLSLAACGSPEAPPIPPTNEIGPPPEASASCLPPFPTFAQENFLIADIQGGRSCTAYLEQDVCVLGIFRDCTDTRSQPREWQGKVETRLREEDGEPITTVTLDAFDPEGPNGPSPNCCTGELRQPEDAPPWALLRCGVNNCRNPNDDAHAGFYLERTGAQPEPYGEASTSHQAPRGVTGAVLVSATRELWLAGDALYAAELQGSSAPAQLSNENIHGLIAPPSGQVYVLTSTAVERWTPASRSVSDRSTLPATPRGMTLGDAGLAVFFRAGDQTRVQLRDPQNLATVLQDRTFSGRTDEIAALPGGGFALIIEGRLDLPRLADDLSERPPLEQPGGALKRFVLGPPDRLAFLAACSNVYPDTRCYFELDPASETLRRIGTPDRDPAVAVAFDPSFNLAILTDGRGEITVIDRVDWRPLFSARFGLQRPVTGLVGDPETGDFYAIDRDGESILRVVRR